METIQLALADDAVNKCWEALKKLRPHLRKSEFLYQIRKLQVESGYHLAFIEKEDKAVSVIGFHISESLAEGKYLYVNDLSTLEPYQKKGFASELLDWVIEYAKTKKCDQIYFDLDQQNTEAKSLCEKRGFMITSHRFAIL